MEDLGAERRGELVAASYGRLVLDAEGKMGLAATGVGGQGEEQLRRLSRQGVPDDVRRIEGSRAPDHAHDLVVPVADRVQVVDLDDDVVEECHECLRWDGNRNGAGACCGVVWAQNRPLISSRGSGSPASWWNRVPPRMRAPQMTAPAQKAPAAHQYPTVNPCTVALTTAALPWSVR